MNAVHQTERCENHGHADVLPQEADGKTLLSRIDHDARFQLCALERAPVVAIGQPHPITRSPEHRSEQSGRHDASSVIAKIFDGCHRGPGHQLREGADVETPGSGSLPSWSRSSTRTPWDASGSRKPKSPDGPRRGSRSRSGTPAASRAASLSPMLVTS